ncbi:MAG: inositol monophosphatase [Planctomycetes bacterium]|nr:inositol monophosphatase [Planctomycetota bacterium]
MAVARRLRTPLGAAVAAIARVAARAQRRLRPADVQRKGVGDFVTTVDVRCERLLRRQLAELLPAAGFLGEELAAVDVDQDWLWVVDPIDGTSNFGRGLPHFAVSVALLWRRLPVLAAIHCLPEDANYVACHGGGTRRNGKLVRAPDRVLDDAAIVGCQWHRGQQQMGFLPRIQARGNRLRTFGSTVTQLADVAMGRLDANVQEQGRVWDIAAAGLIVVEAGCRFTDWSGRAVFPFPDLQVEHTPTIAAAPRAHRELVRALRS